MSQHQALRPLNFKLTDNPMMRESKEKQNN